MKYFLSILAGISFINLSQAQDVAGSWLWVGAGCRDSSLSSSSHVTKAKRNNPFQISASQLNLNADGSASMYIEIEGQRQNETGNYSVRNNEVIIMDPSMSADEPALILSIVEGHLILDASRTIGDDDPGSPELDPVRQACDSGSQTYVYVFANVGL